MRRSLLAALGSLAAFVSACSSPTSPPDASASLASQGVVAEAAPTCEATSLDAVLGSVQLSGTAQVLGSMPLPADVTAIASNDGETLFALTPVGTVRALGTFETLALGDVLGSAVDPNAEIADGSVYVNNMLAASNGVVVAGYTLSGEGFPGKLALLGAVNRYLGAPGNYAYAAMPRQENVDTRFLVNGLGLEGTHAASGASVYGLTVTASGRTAASKVIAFDDAWAALSGPVSMSQAGLGVATYFDTQDYQNHLRVVSAAALGDAFETGTPVVLANAAEAYAGGDVLAVASVGDAVVVQRGNYDGPLYSSQTTDLLKVGTSVSADGSLAVGTPEALATVVDACTRIDFVVAHGEDLLIALADANGRRLVRVQP